MRFYFFILLLALGLSCSKKSDPVSTLKDFINLRFKAGQDLEKIIAFTEGDFKQSLEAMDEEARTQFLSLPIKKLDLDIVNDVCDQVKCSVMYILKYKTIEEEKVISESQVKKVAILQRFESGWKITSIENIKSYHDVQDVVDVVGNN